MKEEEKNALYLYIGSNIKKARSSRKIRQADLAKMVGISRVSIVNIEKGRQSPPIHVIWQIAKSLGFSVEELFPKNDLQAPPSILRKIMDSNLPDYAKRDELIAFLTESNL